MTQLLIKTIADFSTTLTSKTAIGATTATLTSGIDSDGVQLPTGVYGFTIDRNNTQKEHFTATLTGSALTDIKTVTRGTGVGTSGFVRPHRKGAEIVITDHVALKRIMNVLDGTTSLDSATPLGYDGAPTISTGNQLATKTYVDGIAISGSPDATTATKGIVKTSVAPVSAASPVVVGQNDPQFVNYFAETGAADAYVLTPSPSVGTYAIGQRFSFKATNANTTTSTLNINGLGVKTIKKLGGSTDLVSGDIAANMIVSVEYDGTNFLMLNPVANTYLSPTGDGSLLTNLPPRVYKAASSANLKLSADTNRTHNNDGTVLVKSIRVAYSGVISVKFDGKGNGFGGQGRVYLNGTATGTLRSFPNGSYSTYTEDITVRAGDYVQIYSIATGGAVTDIMNFRIYFDTSYEGDGTAITD